MSILLASTRPNKQMWRKDAQIEARLFASAAALKMLILDVRRSKASQMPFAEGGRCCRLSRMCSILVCTCL